VIEDVEIRISSHHLEIADEIMRIEPPGLFGYSASLPGLFCYPVSLPVTFNESSWLSFDLRAFIDNELVTEEYYAIDIDLPVESEPETIHSIEPSRVRPGETLTIYSYMPGMASGRINNGSIRVSIWPRKKGASSPLAANLPANYCGKGIFNTSWQVPGDLDLFDPNWEATELSVEIETYNSELDWLRGTPRDWRYFTVPLGDLFLAISGNIEGDNLELNMSVVDLEFQPVSEANLTLRFEQHLSLPEATDEIIENRSAPLTDFQGKSFYSYWLNESCSWVELRAQASKNDSITVIKRNFASSPYVYFEYFHVVPKNYNYLDVYLEKRKNMIDMTFQAYLGGTPLGGTPLSNAVITVSPLSNAVITVYSVWTRGIMAVKNYTTSENGEFEVKIPYPPNIKGNDEIYLIFGYYNGSVWMHERFYLGYVDRDFNDVGSKKDISIRFEQKEGLIAASFIVKVPESCPFARLYAFAFFEDTDAYPPPDYGYDYRDERAGIPKNNRISVGISYPIGLTPRYLVVYAQIADLSEPSGYRRLIWITDSQGNVLSQERQSESLEARLALGVAVIGGIFMILLIGMVIGYLGHVAVGKRQKNLKIV
jgi:hypothetical protein